MEPSRFYEKRKQLAPQDDSNCEDDSPSMIAENTSDSVYICSETESNLSSEEGTSDNGDANITETNEIGEEISKNNRKFTSC